MNNNQNYYSVIPSFIIADSNLTANAKLLYAVISSLCNQNATCWATNAYFAEIFKTTDVSVSKWIRELIENKYIVSEVLKDENGTRRNIKLDFMTVQKKFGTGIKKKGDGCKEKFKQNNIIEYSINPVNCLNTSLSIKKSKPKKEKPKDFDEVSSYFRDKCTGLFTSEYTNEIATDFYEFYESKGWLVGKSTMKNWQMAANRWIRSSISNEKSVGIERYGKDKNVSYKQKETAKKGITDEEWEQIASGEGLK